MCGWMSIVRVAISSFSRGVLPLSRVPLRRVPRDGGSASFCFHEKLFDRHAPRRELLLEGGVLQRSDRGQVGLYAEGQRIAADDLRQRQILAVARRLGLAGPQLCE